jgi:Immunity protein 22
MRKDGVVSLWEGRADSSTSLDAYLGISYSENGDYIPSLFASDFGIGYYDEDFREARYFEKPLHSVRDLLQDFSYASTIVPRFEQISGSYYDQPIDAIVLLYNFNYDGPIRAIAEGPVQLQYTGAVSQ